MATSIYAAASDVVHDEEITYDAAVFLETESNPPQRFKRKLPRGIFSPRHLSSVSYELLDCIIMATWNEFVGVVRRSGSIRGAEIA
jgi:hypothetical protein